MSAHPDPRNGADDRPARRARRAALLGLVTGLLAGCATSSPRTTNWNLGPFFNPTNFAGVAQLPSEIRRVAVLPVAGLDSIRPESAIALIEAMHTALGRAAKFEVVLVEPAKLAALAGRSPLSSVEALPAELFDQLARDFGADAILFTDITVFRAYQPLAVGVRMKLARATGSRAMLWAFDTVFDARNAAVANAARRHAAADAGSSLDVGVAVLQSPSRFATYVFDETFATLPPRPAEAKVPR